MARRDYVERTYRQHVDSGLLTFSVVVKQTDLLLAAERDLTSEARDSIVRHRRTIERHIARRPEFATSLAPLGYQSPRPILAEMLSASRTAGVGPMAAVAGAIAEYVGRDLLKHSSQVIVENGGDVFLATSEERVLSIFAGESPLSERVGLRVSAESQPLGVCTSAGTVGPSLSFGRADAATVVAGSTALADAVATALANLVKRPEDIEPTLEAARRIDGIEGVVLVKDDRLGAWGNVELVRVRAT